MTPAEIFFRLAAEIAAHPFFWGCLTLAIFLAGACSMHCFAKKWFRALICAALAFECVWVISIGAPR